MLALLGAAAVNALSEGISGESGRGGESCRSCHGGGIAPVVMFAGPSEVVADTTAAFAFAVQSQAERQIVAGFNVAADHGALIGEAQQGVQSIFGELTHRGPRVNDEHGVVSWSFAWQAPRQPGEYLLYGAGLSANGNGTRNGDASAATTAVVTVVAGALSGDGNCDGRPGAADLIARVRALGATADGCATLDSDCDNLVTAIDLDATSAAIFFPQSARGRC